jgi:hypothetical protein
MGKFRMQRKAHNSQKWTRTPTYFRMQKTNADLVDNAKDAAEVTKRMNRSMDTKDHALKCAVQDKANLETSLASSRRTSAAVIQDLEWCVQQEKNLVVSWMAARDYERTAHDTTTAKLETTVARNQQQEETIRQLLDERHHAYFNEAPIPPNG